MPPKVSKEFIQSLKDAGATDEVVSLFRNTGDEQPTEEPFNLDMPPLQGPTLGLGTKNTGVRSTKGALNSSTVGALLPYKMGNKNPAAQRIYDNERFRSMVGGDKYEAMSVNERDAAVEDMKGDDFKYAGLSKDRQKFFSKPVRRSNTKLGAEGKLGETKEVYSPRREMRRAMRVGDVLRKRGYGDVAKDLVRGSLGGAVAPSIQSPQMREAMYQQNIEAQQLDKANQDYMRRIMAQKFNEDQFKIGGV